MPVHGEWRHLRAHAALAEMVGIDRDGIIIAENGSVVELRGGRAELTGEFVRHGARMVDRHSNEDILDEVMEDRQQLSGDGVLVVVAHRGSGTLEVIARGFQTEEDETDVLDDARDAAAATLEDREQSLEDLGDLQEHLRSAVSSVVYDRTRRSPLVVPVLLGD